MRYQFTVQENDKKKREEFFYYIINKYDLRISYPYYKSKFINNSFPFVVDFKEKAFWICESITCCAAAASFGTIFTIEEFKKIRRD
jgi:hypothetical protein